MKKIEDLTVDEKKFVIMLLESANPRTVTTIGDLRQIDKICNVVEGSIKSGDPLEMEDFDYEYTKRRINECTGFIPAAESRKAAIALADKLGI